MNNIITTFKISGLHCESCKKITERRTRKIPGVLDANTDLANGKLTITAEREILKPELTTALAGTEYQVS